MPVRRADFFLNITPAKLNIKVGNKLVVAVDQKKDNVSSADTHLTPLMSKQCVSVRCVW